INLWGYPTPLEVTMDEMLVVLRAVRRGTKRALVSCDFPYGPLQQGTATALEAARRFRDAGADMVKVDDAASNPEALTAALVEEARRCEAAGAAMLDFTNSGPFAGPAVAKAVKIPVIGGLGGGPWLDGRMRMAHAAIGYAATNLDAKAETYANVARITLDALGAYAQDVRSGRQIKGGIPVKPAA